jgi:hypothetical protein
MSKRLLGSLLHDCHILPVIVVTLLLWWYIVVYSLVMVVHSHRQNFLGMFLSYNMLVQILKDLQAVTFLQITEDMYRINTGKAKL